MQRRRQACEVRRHRYASEEDSDGTSSEGSDGSDSATMRCVSCQERYESREAGTCKECYDEANDTEEELKRQIDELKAKLSFLRLDHHHNHNHNLSFYDVVLLASPASSSAPIPAHKAVLASRSPVLRAMLESEMEEGRSGTIRVSDATYEALRAFVGYMYTAEAAGLDEQMACELLVLAEKYEVGHLKAHCESFLVSKLNWDNSVATYAFAHRHNAALLLDAALSHITDNMDKLTLREEYLDLKARDPRLVVDIFEAYLSKQVNTAAETT